MPDPIDRERSARGAVADLWHSYGAWMLALAFVAVFFALMVLKHDAFHTRALDLAKFDQAIWNTLHGRFLFATTQNHSILGNHFSPYMALLAPLYLLWSDVRMLFLVQTIGLAAAGLFLYKIVRLRHPTLAPWFLLAFYLNPALHEVALVEFRRVTLAVPFLALSLYALYAHKRWLMVIGLVFGVLCKEDIALFVALMGVYLVLFEHDWKWGTSLVLLGLAWAVIVTLWVVPAFQPPREGTTLYPQLNYFGLRGDSYGEIIAQLVGDPLLLFRRMFDREGLQALWRVFLPLGVVLPFLALDWVLIPLPLMAYMLMSVAPGMHRLTDWYMASVLPGLSAAIAVGLTRRSARSARLLTVALLCTTIIGYLLFSHAPLGGEYEPGLYKVTDHHRLAARVVAAVPSDARVAAQDPYVPHLSHREHIYLYPWISIGKENIDYFLLDRYLHPYPLQPYQIESEIDNMVADVLYVVRLEGDGIYLLSQGGDPLPAFGVDAVADGTMRLDRVEVAVLGRDGFFQNRFQEPVQLRPADEVRISLYWEALADPNAERTVSVRVTDRSGALAAVQDNLPGKGDKPTSWWRAGWKIRDVYYLTVSPQAQRGPGRLEVLLYDSYSQDIVPFGDLETYPVCTVRIDDETSTP
jgi:uncharacterized membrane protein